MSRIGTIVSVIGSGAAVLALSWTSCRAQDDEKDPPPAREAAPDPAPEAREPAPAVIPIAQIDPDALLYVERLLAVRGFYLGPVDGRLHPELEVALREFAKWAGVETTSHPDEVAARTIDELGAGREVAKRWGSNAPRGEFSPEECYRVNYALAVRGYRTDGTTPARIDLVTLDALRRFQRDVGHPELLGNFVPRRWLFHPGCSDA
jgi:hypothetical protein